MQELWGKWSNPLLPLLPGLVWPEVVAPNRVLSIDQILLFDILNWVQTNDLCKIEFFKIKLIDHLIVCKQMTDF